MVADIEEGSKLWPLNNYIRKIIYNYKVAKGVYKVSLIY